MKAIEKDKLKTEHFELHYPEENMICNYRNIKAYKNCKNIFNYSY